ncbi:MAG: hypothetical protein ACYTJ0_08730, partial [Planctomycetota bacterium]
MTAAPPTLEPILRHAWPAVAVLVATTVHAGGGPQVSTLSETTLPRSGRLLITGSGCGAQQGAADVLVGGHEAIVATWSS